MADCMCTTYALLALPAVMLLWCKIRGLEYILINYRWIFVIFFLMPVSVLYDLYFYIRNMIIFRLNSAPHKHDEKVQEVQRQVLCLWHDIFSQSNRDDNV